jgi:signal transduction histidine kinase
MGLENDDAGVLRKGWDIVARNQNKISSLVMDMLSFSKEREPDPVPSDLVALVTDIAETVQQRADEAGITIHWDPPQDLPWLIFDPEGISRAVLNVVSNALDAVEDRPDPTIEIKVERDRQAGLVRVVVVDNGAGMDAETLATVFNLFVSTKGSRGTGLGLTVSRKILREHGGDILATSKPGAGSTFTLEFPLQESADEPAGNAAPDGPVP